MMKDQKVVKKREFIETWFRRVWRDEDQSAIDEIFPLPGKAEGLGQQTLVGPEDFKKFHTSLCGLLSDIDISIDKYIEGRSEKPFLGFLILARLILEACRVVIRW